MDAVLALLYKAKIEIDKKCHPSNLPGLIYIF